MRGEVEVSAVLLPYGPTGGGTTEEEAEEDTGRCPPCFTVAVQSRVYDLSEQQLPSVASVFTVLE